MVKFSGKHIIRLPFEAALYVVFALVSVLGCGACSSARTHTSSTPAAFAMIQHPMNFALSEHPTEVHKLWTLKVTGLITDLNVSRDGSAVLVAVAPNPDVQGSGIKHHLSLYGRHGKQLWRIELAGAVKSQALSDNGKIALISTYENEVFALDTRGKKLWSIEATCKPIPLKHGFICYHDDDAEPGVGFDLYTDQGKKVLLYPIGRDILTMEVSDDENYAAVALTDGQVVFFGSDFHVLWQKKVEGELVDLAVSSGKNPRVAALYNETGTAQSDGGLSQQKVAIFDLQGVRVGDARPSQHAEQVEMVPDGSGIAVYGNTAQGQYLGFFPIPLEIAQTPQLFAEKWNRGDVRPADYSSNVIVTRDLVILGYEDIAATARHSHLLSFDLAGNLKWNIPLVTEEGAYLYAHGFSSESSLLAVGTDDGYLSAFRLKDGK